jgi:small membrane protein
MSGIQLLLLASLLLILLYSISKLRNKRTDILILSVVIIIGVLLVLFPDWSIIVANKLGVGRGVDLIFYLSILIFWFIVLRLYTRIRKLEQMITQLARKEALENNTTHS